MNKKAKIVGLVLAGALSVSTVVGFVGCSNNDNADNGNNQQIEQIGGKVDDLDGKVGGLDGKVNGLDGKIDDLGNKLDELTEAFDNITTPPAYTHDPNTLLTNRGEYRPHNFDADGNCKLCDEKTIFMQESIVYDKKYTTECDQKGTVTELEYRGVGKENAESGTIQIGDKKYNERTAYAYVYTPYGYNAEDKNTKYNVLIMLHGKGLSEGFWFAKGGYNPKKTNYNGYYCTETVLDNMIKSGEAEKTIFVTYSYRGLPSSMMEAYNGKNSEECGDQKEEVTKYLMPLIAKKYNTYANVTNNSTPDQVDAALKAARAHQGFVGLSMGSATSWSMALNQSLDYFAYIGSYSGGGSSAGGNTTTINAIKAAETAGKPLLYWYNGLGTMEKGGDTPWNGAGGDYPGRPFSGYVDVMAQAGLQSGSDIAKGDNCEFVWCNQNGHSYMTWITCLANSMKVFFKAPEAVAEYTNTVTGLESGNTANYKLSVYADNTYKLVLDAAFSPIPSMHWGRVITAYGTLTAAAPVDGKTTYTLASPTRITVDSVYKHNSAYKIDTAKTYDADHWLEPTEFNEGGWVMYQQSSRACPEIWKSPADFLKAYGRTYTIVGSTDGTMTVTLTGDNTEMIDGYYAVGADGKLIVLEQ